MFYNAWAPPTENPISTDKLIYGHYCNNDNVQAILNMDSTAFENAVVICKYGGGAGRPDKARGFLYKTLESVFYDRIKNEKQQEKISVGQECETLWCGCCAYFLRSLRFFR